MTASSSWGVIRHYWRVSKARGRHLAIPALLSLIASAFEGFSLALIIPLADAVSQNSFDFLDTSTAFGWLPSMLPSRLAEAPNHDLLLLGCIAALVFIGRVGKLATFYLANLYRVARDARYRVRIGRDTFARVLRFGRQYFDRHAVGSVDAELAWSDAVLGLLVAAEGVFSHVLAIGVKSAVMFAISPALLVGFLVTVPLVQWMIVRINRAILRVAQSGTQVERGLRAELLDLLGAVPLLKAHSQEAAAAGTYGRLLRNVGQVAVRRTRVVGVRYPIEELSTLLAMLVVQGVVIYASGDFRPADLATFAAFLVVMQQSMADYKRVSKFTVEVFNELPRLEAVAGLFSDAGKHIVPSGSNRFEGLRDGITLDALKFAYGEDPATLAQVDGFIPARAMTAIVGPSGSGKTTLVNLVARLYDCPPASILLDGRDIRSLSIPSLHSRLTIVSQEVWLLHRSVRENLTFGLDTSPTESDLQDALADAHLTDLVESLPEGLATVVGDRGVRLSGGQRQRLALARALLRDPDILILDEATSAVDSVTEQALSRTLRRRMVGRTLIVVAHRLSTLRDADQILVMEDGRLVEAGPWDELRRRRGLFSALLSAQSDDRPRGGAAGLSGGHEP
jgi:ATP-binding cassette, subfamily B, bacterial MsbA